MKTAIVFDTETTGLPDWKNPSEAEHQPHLVQLAAHQFEVSTGKILQSMDVIIKPEGWQISKEVSDIHGITQERAFDVGISEKLALEMFLELWGGRVRIAHNTTFDNRIIRIATKRYSPEHVIQTWADGDYECTGLLSKPIMQMPPYGKYGFKMPKLEEAYKYFTGRELQNAHTAIADCNACLEVYMAIKTQKEAA
jgi:DNA polymerase III subunit epsilon